ncbi:helix-turn-helix domain-containing protein [Dysgonomonas sp. 25]|uniref:helix-turn-helix domain-containing protein n=1 Tax=Dysgonomonas sp. 25 TaxID=2302933 RepID=UPI0013D6D3BC|nr:helix-turn-helix transcriptional regulator [Dysgonomonas sp. 25]NDV69687.1 XRE family transcriptional regulator [Dysgonomonas sp. 25]
MDTAKENNSKHHGENIRKIRRIIGLNQYDLADKMNTNQQFVSRMESKEELDEETLQKVSKALGVPVELIKEYDHESTIQNFFNNTINTVNGDCFINPLETVKDLYERLLKEKDEKIQLMEQFLKEKKK